MTSSAIHLMKWALLLGILEGILFAVNLIVLMLVDAPIHRDSRTAALDGFGFFLGSVATLLETIILGAAFWGILSLLK